MIRQGKYTKRPSRFKRAKTRLSQRVRWFRKLSWQKKLALISVPVIAFLVITPFATYAYYSKDIADKERLMNRNSTGVVLLDRDGEVFYSTGKAGSRQVVPLDEISQDTIDALIAAEDKNFYDHDGFSITGIIRAFYGNLLNREITSGGSTITQQLVKNTLLTERQTFMRKYQELAIAVAVENRYSKDEILEMYLNSIFFGGTVFGIGEAAEFYFDSEPSELDLAQSTMLVGILPAPNAYSPTLGNIEYAKERQRTVLDRMVRNEYITSEQADEIFSQELAYAPPGEAEISIAPHFAQMVLDELYEEYGEEVVTRSGYQVQTTLDADAQRALAKNISGHIGFVRANGGSNAAGVAIDPESGGILALVGSADWSNDEWGKVNVVTSARQPGSSFKPIYYSAALDEGTITPATILSDTPTDFGGGYRPLNADRQFRGNVTVRNALSQSLNIPSVEVLKELGIEKGVEVSEKLGITTLDSEADYGLSLALGSAEVPLLEMTSAYAAFANEGQHYKVSTIQQIDDKFNDLIYRAPRQAPTSAISPEGAFLISDILSDNSARAPIFGDSLTVPGRKAAVKTGTTDDQRDAWTIGYTPQIAVGVWVGNNDNKPMLNGGAGMAGPIWINTINEALTGLPNASFTVPGGIVQRAVCIGQEALATRGGFGTFMEYFRSSALPSQSCTPAEEPEPEKEEEPEPEENEEQEGEDETEDETPPPGDEGDGEEEEPNPPTDPPVGPPSGARMPGMLMMKWRSIDI